MASDPTIEFAVQADLTPYLDAVAKAMRDLRASIGADLDPTLLSLDECDFYGLTRPGRDDDYCDMSFLRKTQCACCLGHIIDADLEEASKSW